MEDKRFWKGIEEYNQGYFFESHDTLEDLWHETRGRDRLFLQGLIQISVGFHHFFGGNYRGATSQLTKGLEKLQSYRPFHAGIELDRFINQVSRWAEIARKSLDGVMSEFDESDVPKIQTANHIQ